MNTWKNYAISILTTALLSSGGTYLAVGMSAVTQEELRDHAGEMKGIIARQTEILERLTAGDHERAIQISNHSIQISEIFRRLDAIERRLQ